MSWLDKFFSGIRVISNPTSLLPSLPNLLFRNGFSTTPDLTGAVSGTPGTVIVDATGGSYGKINLPLVNGTNSNVATNGSALQVIGGPTAAFALGSVLPSSALLSGQPVTFEYTGGQAWSLVHQDTAATGSSLKFSVVGQSVAGSQILVFGKVSAHYDGTNLVVDLGAHYKRDFDIREYGASTSASDNTAAIQAALNAAAPFAGTVIVPPGVWLYTGTLSVPIGVSIEGVGAGYTAGAAFGCELRRVGFGDGIVQSLPLNNTTQSYSKIKNVAITRDTSILSLTPWTANTAYSSGQVGSYWYMGCQFSPNVLQLVTAGTSGQVEPIYRLATGADPFYNIGTAITLTHTSLAAVDDSTTIDCTIVGVAIAGTVTVSGTAVTGSGTSFTTALAPGQVIQFNDANNSFCVIQSITDNTHLTLTFAGPGTATQILAGTSVTVNVTTSGTSTTQTVPIAATVAVQSPAAAYTLQMSTTVGAYTPGVYYQTPQTRWSLLAGDIVNDGTAQWRVVRAGAGLFVTGALGIHVEGVFSRGHMFDVVADQCELMLIGGTTSLNSNVGIWYANTAAYNTSATQYSGPNGNRNTVHGSVQINGGIGVVDDGGYDHKFTDVNWNCAYMMAVLSGTVGCTFDGGEYEGANNLLKRYSNLCGIKLNPQTFFDRFSIPGQGNIHMTGGGLFAFPSGTCMVDATNRFSEGTCQGLQITSCWVAGGGGVPAMVLGANTLNGFVWMASANTPIPVLDGPVQAGAEYILEYASGISHGGLLLGGGYSGGPQRAGALLHVTGSIALTTLPWNTYATISTGVNDDVPLPYSYSKLRIIPSASITGPFSIHGIAAQVDGFELEIINESTYPITYGNQSASSAAANRIWTPSNADVSQALDASGFTIARLRYNGSISRWQLVSG